MCFILLFILFTAPVGAQQAVWIQDLGICNTSSIQVPVWFYNAGTTIDDFDIHLGFDNSLLAFVDVTPADVSADWDTLNGAESTPGELTITGSAGTGTPVFVYTEDILFYANFTCAACVPGSYSDLILTLPGGDLTGFTTANGSFTWYDNCGISLPDLTGCMDPVQYSVALSNTNPVDDLSFQIQYDPAMLSFDAFSQAATLTADWVYFTCFEITGSPGTLQIVGSTSYGGTVIPAASSGNLVDLSFQITCDDCAENDMSPLSFTSLDGDLADYTATDGSFTYQCGAPGPDALIIGDVAAAPPQTVYIPVSFDNSPNTVDAFGFDVFFCTDMLRFDGCSSGDLTAAFEIVDGFEASPGIITVGGYSENPIPSGSTGTVAVLEFTITCFGCENDDFCVLQASNLVDDIEHWETGDGTFTFHTPVLPVLSGVWLILLLVLLLGIAMKRSVSRTAHK